MKIGGWQKFSLIDFPGKISAVIFTQGCPWRCPWCHNRSLVLPEEFGPPIPEEEVLQFLETRLGQIEGVVVTGGEPTFQSDLPDFLGKLRGLDFQVKLDTNGGHPEIIESMIGAGLIDYIAMDVKAPLQKYHQATGRQVSIKKIRRSIDLIRNSGLDHEFRTTLVPGLHTEEDIEEILDLIQGSRRYALQTFQNNNTLEPALAEAQQPATPWKPTQTWLQQNTSRVGELIVR